MTNNVQVFDSLKVKEVNGQVMFDAETAAIGIGISETKKNGVVYPIWNRVNKYLGLSTKVSKISKGDFITEPQFYKLVIKANSPVADKFQDWVTEEVLPSIRKTGSYQAKPVSATQQARLALEASVELDDRVTKLEENVVINPTDYGTIGVEVNRRVNGYVKLHHISRENRHLLFEDLNGQIKKITGARNRSRIKSKDYDMVMDFIERWQPTTATVMQAEQTELDV